MVGKGIAVFPACRTAGLRGGAPPRAAGGADSASCAQTFLAARGRNHQVNREAVALLAEGIVKQVCFLQEDSAPQGMHCAEQKQLQALAEAQDVSEQVSIHCGTDECACALGGWPGRTAPGPGARPSPVMWSGWPGYAFTARYEDRPFAENLDAYLKTCRIMRVQSPKDAQAVLGRLCAQWPANGPGHGAGGCRLRLYARPAGQHSGTSAGSYGYGPSHWPFGRLSRQRRRKQPSAPCRTKRPSGAPCRICRMEYSMQFTWHHSGALLAAGAGASPAALAAFTQERLLDDWVYQAIVRPRWNRELRAAGTDIWGLQDVPGANARLQQLMELTRNTPCVQQAVPRAAVLAAHL